MLPVPPKGKLKEPDHWRAGWWDFYPFVEPKRPIQWSHSSVIFTAHPTQPLVVARHISSSKQFILPSPPPILESPLSYDPPSIILGAPGDNWLFAYFPRQDNDGTGCLWTTAAHVDNWQIKEWWSFPSRRGVVAGKWLSNPRDWIPGPSGLPMRLPPLGPKTPITNHCLLLVTQDYQVHLCYFRLYAPTITCIKCSLEYPGLTKENQPSNVEERSEGSKASRLCVDAAIGLSYNESSILVAMHSHCVPSPSILPPHDEPMTGGVPTESTRYPGADLNCSDWETWGEESSIGLYEVQIKFDGATMAIATRPLSPPDQADGKLSGLTFLSATSEGAEEKGKLYLVATYLNFEDYATTPTSQLVVFSLNRRSSPSGTDLLWTCSRECVRSFDQGVLAFTQPLTTINQSLILAGVLDSFGTRKGNRQSSIGTIMVLNIRDLTENKDWEQLPIRSPPDQIGREVPLSVTISPNCKLLCALSSSSWHSQIAIHALPKCRSTNGLISNNPQLSLALDLASAILGRRTVDDIVHILSLQNLPINELVEILNYALEVLDRSTNVTPRSTTWDVLGAAAGIYRSRALTAVNDTERETLNARWQAAHDMCSIAACNTAFEDCKEGETYGLDAVWQLIGLCRWVVEFFEKLMKECVLYSNPIQEDSPAGGELFGSKSYPPILLNLAHPYATQNLFILLQHLKRFRTYLGSLSAGGENSRIARDVLVDLVDCSGVDFEALYPVLEEIVQKSKTHDDRVCRKALASFQAPTTMHRQLAAAVQMLTHSSILNKSTLFIDPFDLVDGITRLSVHNQRKGKDRDVVSKSALSVHTSSVSCLRCRGKSDLGSNLSSLGKPHSAWRTWENMWVSRCICGGPWSSSGL